MSFSQDISTIANVLHETRASQAVVDNAAEQNKTDPIEEGRLFKLHKMLDNADEQHQKSKRLSTIEKTIQKKHNSIEAFLRGQEENNKTIHRTKSSGTINTDSFYSTFADDINTLLEQTCVMRKLATKVTISGEFFEGVSYPNAITTNWSAQGTTVAAAPTVTAQNFVKKVIQVFDLTAQPQVTNRMVSDVDLDLESYILQKLAEMFASQENNAFINGDGIAMPQGILSYTNTARRVTSKNAANISVDGLMGLYYSLPDLYSDNASFIMHKSSVYSIRSMKDSAGQYLWMPGVLNGTSDMLLGCPLYTTADMPQVATNKDAVIFGNIAKAYTIVDRNDFSMQRDPFSNKPYINYYTTKRVGGDVVDLKAISIMRIGA